MPETQKLKGQFTLSRCSGLKGTTMHLQVRDEMSNQVFLTGVIGLSELMLALTGQSDLPIDLEVQDAVTLSRLGHVRELCEVEVELSCQVREDPNLLAQVLMEFEQSKGEGWTFADPQQANNPHHWTGTTARMTMERFVLPVSP